MVTKLLLPFSLLTIQFNIGAQMVVDSTFFNNEAAVKYYLCDPSTPNFAASTGAMQTYDYSNAIYIVDSTTAQRISASSTPFASDFPDANTALFINGIGYTYYSLDADSMVQRGYVIPDTDLDDIKAQFNSNYWWQLAFDCYPNTSTADAYAGNISFTLNGNVQNPTHNGVGYSRFNSTGSLTLPGGTVYSNVARLEFLDTLYTTVALFGPVKLVRQQFEYYDMNNPGEMPLFLHTTARILGNFPDPLFETILVMSQEKPNAVLLTQELSNSEIHIYPNPSSGFVSLKGWEGKVNYTVSTLEGKEIERGVWFESGTLQLEKGIYLVQLNKSNGSRTFKVVIQ